MDLSGAYRRSFDVALPHAGQVADPFHVIRLGNNSIDEVRRRVQNDTLGHRGRKQDPLYRVRRLLISAHERLSEGADTKLRGLLGAGDPRGEVRLAWHAKETLRGLYDIDCPQLADVYLRELTDDLTDTDCPPELSRLGRTLRRWHHQIINWHQARVSNGPTEAVILWSVSEGVVDVADGYVAGSGGRVLWIVSSVSAMLLSVCARQSFLRLCPAGGDVEEVANEGATVSRSWLYRQPDLRAEINRLRRVTTTQAVPIPSPERGSTESLRQRLEAALDEITRLKADNHHLREHLGQHLGHQRQTAPPPPSTTCLPHETQAPNHNSAKPSR